ncbi:MAG: acyltransferase [Ilumatobacteraceae bacterium]
MAGANRYVDFLRAFSLLVVVAWHWVFTIIRWQPDGPHATNPIGFTTGLWMATWLLQVMPLFFYVGGFAHLRAWDKARRNGTPLWSFVFKRVRSLAVPALVLLGVWIVIAIVLSTLFDIRWITRAAMLVVSPLWFLGVYLLMIVLLPMLLWLHQRFDTIVLVWLAALAGGVDILRFRYHQDVLAYLNMIFVWGLCFQLGFFYDRIVAAQRRADYTMLWAGLAGLAGLVFSGLYPGSMVGVPGETSNMAPPTLCIVALVLFQAGVAEALRPAMQRRLARPRWASFNETINRLALPLFLFHTTGMALWKAVRYAWAGHINEAREPTLWWWLGRPLAFVGPLLFTLPVIYLFGRKWTRKQQPSPSSTAPA